MYNGIAYFDNAATTFPKPEQVYTFMDSFYRECGVNVGRGQHKLAARANALMEETRELLLNLFHCENKRVVFTSTATEAINLVLNGIDIPKNANVYISPFEHNAVTRVLHNLQKKSRFNIEILSVNKEAIKYDTEQICEQFRNAPPYCVVVSHASKDIQTGRSTEFAQAVKRLLGLDSYVAALTHLKGYQRTSKNSVIGSYDEQYDEQSDSRIAEKTKEINKYAEKINQSQDRKAELEERIPQAEEECDKLKILIEQNKESETLSQEKAKLIQKRNKAETYISGSTKMIMEDFHKYYHSYFTQKMIADTIELLASADKLDKGIPDIHKRTIDYLIKQGRCICGTPIELDNEAHRELMKLLQFIPPQSIGTLIGAFARECKLRSANGVNLCEKVADKLSVLREKEDDRDSANSDISAIDEKLSKLQSVGEAQRKLMAYEKSIRDDRDEISQIDNRIGALETQKERAETERKAYSLKNENNKKVELYKAYAEYIYNVLKEDYAVQEAEVRKKLEDCINSIFKTIYAGGFSLSIDDKYNIQTRVDNFSEYNIDVETSTAQSISIIFAFIAGVIKLARENDKENEMLSTEAYPLVMDAPLSAFDKTRIQTVCETLPNIAEQVIIFIKDTDGEIAETYLSHKIGKNYMFDKKNEFETYLTER